MVSGLVTSPNDHSLMRSGDASLRLMVSNPFKFVIVFDFIKVLNTNYKWGANNTNDANGIIRVCLFVKAFAYFIRVIRDIRFHSWIGVVLSIGRDFVVIYKKLDDIDKRCC